VPVSADTTLAFKTKTNEASGSGCIAALEAEKYLAEKDDTVDNELETENQAEKSQTNGVVPEYRSNPLL
jgi:thioredoxin reductase (NADPH)